MCLCNSLNHLAHPARAKLRANVAAVEITLGEKSIRNNTNSYNILSPEATRYVIRYDRLWVELIKKEVKKSFKPA